MDRFCVVKRVRLHLYGSFIDRNTRHTGEFGFFVVSLNRGKNVKKRKKRQERKGEITAKIIYSQNDWEVWW